MPQNPKLKYIDRDRMNLIGLMLGGILEESIASPRGSALVRKLRGAVGVTAGKMRITLRFDEDGVTVKHWQRSHAKDGASGYRLDWNGLCFVWTGDGRPSKLDEKYAKGCDVYVTEMQPEPVEISSGVQGVPPFLARYTIDTHHTPGYAAGYLANKVQPRLFMTPHMPLRWMVKMATTVV